MGSLVGATGPLGISGLGGGVSSSRVKGGITDLVVSSSSFTGQLRIGSTRTHQDDLTDVGGSPGVDDHDGVGQALSALSLVNQHILGFGGDDDTLWPSAVSDFDFSHLDNVMGALAAIDGVEVMVTFCGCPTWMSEGTQEDDHGITWPTGHAVTDYYPPHPDNLVHWATLCATVAARYDGSGVDKTGTNAAPPAVTISMGQMWNEMKKLFINSSHVWSGPDGNDPNSSDVNREWYEHYTAMYDTAYAAIKAVRPDFTLGGPYNVMQTFDEAFVSLQDDTLGLPFARPLARARATMEYFLANSTEFDGLCLTDVKSQNNDYRENVPDFDGNDIDPFSAMGYKMRWIRAWINDLPASAAGRLDIGISEYYTMGDWRDNAMITAGDPPFQLWEKHPTSSFTANKLRNLMVWSWIETLYADIDWILMWKLFGGFADRTTQSTWPLGLVDLSGTDTEVVTPLRWWKDHIVGQTCRRVRFPANPNLMGVQGDDEILVVSRSPDAQQFIYDAVTHDVPADYGIAYIAA